MKLLPRSRHSRAARGARRVTIALGMVPVRRELKRVGFHPWIAFAVGVVGSIILIKLGMP